MQEMLFTPEDVQDRLFWKSRIRAAYPTWWEKAKKKKKDFRETQPEVNSDLRITI